MKNNSNLWLGGLLIFVGFVFLLANTGLLSFQITKIVISWQMLIVAIGLISLMRRHYFSATVLLVIGFYFLLPRIFNVLGFAFPIDFAIFRNLFWAILFIVVGLAIIFGRGEIKRISI